MRCEFHVSIILTLSNDSHVFGSPVISENISTGTEESDFDITKLQRAAKRARLTAAATTSSITAPAPSTTATHDQSTQARAAIGSSTGSTAAVQEQPGGTAWSISSRLVAATVYISHDRSSWCTDLVNADKIRHAYQNHIIQDFANNSIIIYVSMIYHRIINGNTTTRRSEYICKTAGTGNYLVLTLSSPPSLEKNIKSTYHSVNFAIIGDASTSCSKLYNWFLIGSVLLSLSILSAPPERATILVHHASCYQRDVIKPELPIEEILYKNVLLCRPFDHWPILSTLTTLWSLYIATDIILHVISPRYTDGIPGIGRFHQDVRTCTIIYSWQWPISLYQVMCN